MSAFRDSGHYRIVLADDHAIVRDGIRLLLGMEPGFEVVAEVASLETLRACVALHEPDVLVLDYHMPGGDASASLAYIKQRYPNIKVVALTASRSPAVLRQLLDVRADAVLLKEDGAGRLIQTLRAVLIQGRRVVPENVASVIEVFDALLSKRELQVLKMLCDGASNQSVAQLFSISVKTVEKHRENILRKMEVSSLAELYRKAQSMGLLQPDSAPQ